MGDVPKKNFLKIFLCNKVYFPNFANRYILNPVLTILLCFEIIPKNAFSGFCQKFPQAMHEVENFFCQFPNLWTLRMSGMGGYTVKKSQNHCTLPCMLLLLLLMPLHVAPSASGAPAYRSFCYCCSCMLLLLLLLLLYILPPASVALACC